MVVALASIDLNILVLFGIFLLCENLVSFTV